MRAGYQAEFKSNRSVEQVLVPWSSGDTVPGKILQGLFDTHPRRFNLSYNLLDLHFLAEEAAIGHGDGQAADSACQRLVLACVQRSRQKQVFPGASDTPKEDLPAGHP